MTKKGFNYLVAGLAIFFALLALEIWLSPAALTANSGISYFSVNHRTILPYLFGLWLPAFLIWQATRFFKDDKFGRTAKRLLRYVAAFMILLTGAPDVSYTIFANIHVFFGTGLFLTEVVMAIWILREIYKDWLGQLLIFLQFLGGLLAMFSLIDWLGWSIEGQIFFQFTFVLLLIRTALLQLCNNQPLPDKKN